MRAPNGVGRRVKKWEATSTGHFFQKTVEACSICHNTKTVEKRYLLPDGQSYSTKYFDCKHPLGAKPVEKPRRWAERFGT
jgi:hypothetical protein